MSYVPELFEAKDYATAIKVLDSMAEGAEGVALASLLCNRGLCYQRMDLHRKALRNYEEALKANPYFSRAHMGRGKSLHALGRTQEARQAWKAAVDGFSPADDLLMMADAIAYYRHPDLSIEPVGNSSQEPSRPPSLPSNKAQSPVQPGNAQQLVANGAAKPMSPAVRQTYPQKAPPPESFDAAAAIGIAVEHINSGQVDQAILLLDSAINSSAEPNMGALIARGTARALKRDLKGAIKDFTGAIAIYPNYGDTWKRRGQARSADGDSEGATTDFMRALELISDNAGRAEIRTEIAVIYQKDSNLKKAERELALAVRLDDTSSTSWNQLGVCRAGMGRIEEGCRAYRKAISLDPRNYEAWLNLASAHKEGAHAKEAEAAFKEALKLYEPGKKGEAIWRMYAHMKQGMGEHAKAIKAIDQGLQFAEGGMKVQLSYLRGACNQALGFYKEAIVDYTRAFSLVGEDFSEEVRQQQALSVLQRELVLYAYNHLDDPVREFSLDQDIHPLFKELWTHKNIPSPGQLMICQQRHPRVPSEADPLPPPALPNPEETIRLLDAADRMGALLQNRHQGFLRNKRQHRMGGLAAIELAQAVQHLIDAKKKGEAVIISRGATSSVEPHEFGWRDAMDIAVKWRQISEPNDQVIWVDLLTKAEFEHGFGSHTPMYSGQAECVRYFMNFRRAMALLKSILLKEGKAIAANQNDIPLVNKETIERINKAETAEEMWSVIGQDSYSVVPIKSILHPDVDLEGTRLTVVKLKGPEQYEASIRTPVTPLRWKEFDKELRAVWEALIESLCAEDKPKAAVSILTFAYYWYNFMPLARGSAVCGHIFLLSMFALAGMPLTAPIPSDYQIDWEALLQQSPAEFIESLSSWLLPVEALAKPKDFYEADDTEATLTKSSDMTGSGVQSTGDALSSAEAMTQLEQKLMHNGVIGDDSSEPNPNPIAKSGSSGLKGLPFVRQLLPTLRNRLEALNGPGIARLQYP